MEYCYCAFGLWFPLLQVEQAPAGLQPVFQQLNNLMRAQGKRGAWSIRRLDARAARALVCCIHSSVSIDDYYECHLLARALRRGCRGACGASALALGSALPLWTSAADLGMVTRTSLGAAVGRGIPLDPEGGDRLGRYPLFP